VQSISFIFALLCFYFAAICAAGVPDPVHNVTLWDNIVKKYVIQNQTLDGVELSVIDYEGIANDTDFQEYMSWFNYVNASALTRDETYAFFVNVYNVFAINMIIQHSCRQDLFGNCGSIHSIRDLGTLIPDNPVWGQYAGQVGNVSYSLDDVENYLRAPGIFAEDCRLHSAIVCASVSCPNVRKGAYTVANIDEELTSNFNDFLDNDKKGMYVDQTNNIVYLSSIFDWFESDFTGSYLLENVSNPTVIDFILLYLYPNNVNYQYLSANSHKVQIQHFNYDWDVNAENGVAGVPCSSHTRPCFTLFALVILLVCFGILVVIFAIVIVVVKKGRRRGTYTPVNN